MFEPNPLEYVYTHTYIYIEEKCTYKKFEVQIFDFYSKSLIELFYIMSENFAENQKYKIFTSMPT